MLEVDARAAALGGRADLHFRRSVPARSLPGEDDARRRLECRDRANDELLAVREALVESPARPGLEVDLIGARAAEGVAFLQRPPLADVLGEDAEGRVDRAFHVDRLPDRHSLSSCSANVLNARNA